MSGTVSGAIRTSGRADIARDETRVHRLRFGGLWPNALLLGGVILSVALLDPGKPLPGTDWHPWLYLREVVQLALVALSLALGSSHLRRSNRFNYAAILEVAVLFFGIFICMQPALQILAVEGPNLGLTEPWHYFWASGGLSSVLDNAPTYVVFFETAKSLTETARPQPGRGRRGRAPAGGHQPRARSSWAPTPTSATGRTSWSRPSPRSRAWPCPASSDTCCIAAAS